MKVSDTRSSYMRSPEPVYLFFYFLQMGTADWKRFAIFEICHAVTDFHNLYDIHDITPVNENKFLCLQFIKNRHAGYRKCLCRVFFPCVRQLE